MGVNNKKVTKWFDGKTTVPGQPGVYERKPKYDKRIRVFSRWDGTRWNSQFNSVANGNDEDVQYQIDCASTQINKSAFQDRDWRGLVEESK